MLLLWHHGGGNGCRKQCTAWHIERQSFPTDEAYSGPGNGCAILWGIFRRDNVEKETPTFFASKLSLIQFGERVTPPQDPSVSRLLPALPLAARRGWPRCPRTQQCRLLHVQGYWRLLLHVSGCWRRILHAQYCWRQRQL